MCRTSPGSRQDRRQAHATASLVGARAGVSAGRSSAALPAERRGKSEKAKAKGKGVWPQSRDRHVIDKVT